MPGERIAVIGAGPMGLAVAYQLAKDGHCPVLYEADDRVGGMSASFDWGGLRLERYYHFHCLTDGPLLEMLDELGLRGKLHWVGTKMGYYYQGKVVPWGNPLALLKFPGLSLISKLRYVLHIFVSIKRNNWRRLDQLEATAWIRRWIGEEAYDVLWRSLFDYKFYHYAHSLSAAWISTRIRRLGRSRDILFRERLGYLEGGSETLLEAMRLYIEAHGGQIHLSSPVSQVVIVAGQVKGVKVGNDFEEFPKVISTVPLPYVPEMMPDLPEEVLSKFRAVQSFGVVCVIAKLRRAVTENFWLNVNDPEVDIPGVLEYTNLRPLDTHVIYVPFYLPEDYPKFQEPDQVFQDKVRHYLQTINPELTDRDFLGFCVNRYRCAQPVCTPRFLEKLPPVGLPIRGLWAADTSYYYPEDRSLSESIGFGRRLAKRAVV